MSQNSTRSRVAAGEGLADRSIQTVQEITEAATSQTVAQVDHMVERIRSINEQLIEATAVSGRRVLDTYERTLRTMLEAHVGMAQSTHIEWVNVIARAKAQFMLEVSTYYTKAARDLAG